jgi:mannose-1-phosphate guanylyltransferase
MESRRWGVILAGGDGTRLKALSRLISGDNRPKQFCALFGGGSLLARTRGRIAPAISPGRMLFVVVRDHERFYLPELADVDASRIVVQPANRGTTAAIIYSLLRLTRLEGDPIVAFFPADHHYADETQFTRAVNAAFEMVHKHPELLVLLGAKAEDAQVEYGWIEPGQRLDAGRTGKLPIFSVNRFWEKPTAGLAQTLLGKGCLWNTFVIAGRALTFLEILQSRMPEVLKAFQPVANSRMTDEEAARATELYETLPAGDFSREVLTECAEKLAVLRMDDAGWGDLGTPEGVFAAIQRSAPSSRQVTPDTFTAWLAGYGEQLERVRRHGAGNDAAT